MLAAAALVVAGLVLAKRDPAGKFTENRDAWEAYDQGERLLQSFRFAEATAKLEEAVALDPGLGMAHIALAEVYNKTGMPDDSRLHRVIADSLADLTDNEESRLLLQVRLAGGTWSRFHSQRDSLVAAARDLCPDHIVVLVSEANHASGAGEVETAERVWNHILEINPNYAAAYNYLGYLYLANGEYDKAESAMRRYAFVAPDLANPHDSLGEVLMYVGRYEEALQEFKWALAKQPDFFHSYMNMGRIHFARGEVDRANELFDQIRAEFEGTDMLHYAEIIRLGALFDHRVMDDYITYADRFIAEFPKSSLVQNVRLRQRMARQELDLALALLDSAKMAYRSEDWYPQDSQKRGQVEIEQVRYRGLLAEMAGDYATASQAFRQSLEYRASLPPHERLFDQVHLALNLAPIGGFDEARRVIRQALSLNPRLPESLLVAAAVEAAAGEAGEAHRILDALDRALELADEDYPAVLDVRRLREQLPEPGQI